MAGSHDGRRDLEPVPSARAGSGRALLLVVLLSVVVRIVPAFAIHGTEDVWAWRFAVDVREQGRDPYNQDYLFNWPPV